jgi:single-stranded-DNA-specific exonuclease
VKKIMPSIRWKILDADEAKVNNLQQQLKIHPLLCKLLVQRGVETYDEAHQFFRPNLNQLHDPFLMNDMDKAVNRIQQAIAANEKIIVYGDYDVDGTTAVSVVYGFFNSFYKNIQYYIPDRYSEGYGISFIGIDWAKTENATLIIALDCGITALEQIDYAQQKGIDFIICDHHRPGDKLPNAVAVLDAKRKDNTYPYDELSGCGVGFKLIQAFAQQFNIDFSEVEKQLDLVAVSIASDIVPVTGENRVLAHFGLQKLNNNPRPGIKTLIEISSIKSELTINSLVFTIGPKINAAGRIEHGSNAVKLLVADNLPDAFEFAHVLNSFNVERKGFDKSITEQALAMLDNDAESQNKKSTVVVSEGWHKGVIGIVASRLMESYYRPTIVLAKSNGTMVGSARSVKDFDVYDALKKCEDLLEKFGGHKYAAGLQMKSSNYEIFCERFEKAVAETITDAQLIPEITIDSELELNDISYSFYNILKQFAPFGPGNMTPLFISKNLTDYGTRLLSDKHLKFSIRNAENQRASGIGFDMKHHFETLKNNLIDIIYSLEENEWQGNKTIEWRIRDIKKVENYL